MNYELSLDRKSVGLMVAGFAALGILLFLAGFIVGLERGMSDARKRLEKEYSAKLAAISAQKSSAPDAAEARSAESPASMVQPPQMVQTQKEEAQGVLAQPSATPAIASEGLAAGDGQDFSVQFGAFQDESRASQLRDGLKARGYPAFVFQAVDANGHSWHAVRMGHYKEFKLAALAAVAFTGKEKMPAFIRPANTL